MHERRFNQEIERLRDPERVARLEIERVINLCLENLVNVQSVLDIGTGSGLFAEQFALKGLHVTGLDANPEMVLVAQQCVPSGTFQNGVAEKLPFPNGSFDVVFMGLMLHEADDAPTAMQEAQRVALYRLAILEWPDEEQSFGPPRGHRFSFDKIISLAKPAGFKKVNQVRLESLILYQFDR